MHNTPRKLIRDLGLQPHPEGGFYREIHRSRERVTTARGRRSALTTIYFLLAKGQPSVFHRVTSDEVWHYYGGSALRLWRVAGDFSQKERITLGPTERRATRVAVIPRGDWQAAESLGEYTLVGCTVGPGFDFADFTMLRDASRAAARMESAFPALAKRFC